MVLGYLRLGRHTQMEYKNTVWDSLNIIMYLQFSCIGFMLKWEWVWDVITLSLNRIVCGRTHKMIFTIQNGLFTLDYLGALGLALALENISTSTRVLNCRIICRAMGLWTTSASVQNQRPLSIFSFWLVNYGEKTEEDELRKFYLPETV